MLVFHNKGENIVYKLENMDSFGEIMFFPPRIYPKKLMLIRALREFDIDMAIDLVQWIQRRNHRSYLSHRKKKIADALRNQVSL